MFLRHTSILNTTRCRTVGHDTAFHSVIRNSVSPDDVHAFIKLYSQSQIAKMARTTNDLGEIPLDLILETPFLYYDKVELQNTIVKSILNEDMVKPLKQRIYIDDVLKRYNHTLDDSTRSHLELACTVVNDVRGVIFSSASHPEMNHYDYHKQQKILSDLEVLRSQTLSDEPMEVADLCSKLKVGNCSEYAMSAIDALKFRSKNPINASYVHIENGDHAFVVISHDKLPDFNQYTDTMTQAVFCDPWSGTVGKFVDRELIDHIGSVRLYYSTNVLFNIVTTFNPSFHRLKVDANYSVRGTEGRTSLCHDSFFAMKAKRDSTCVGDVVASLHMNTY